MDIDDEVKVPEAFALTAAERHSPQWARLAQHIQTEIATLRAQNDGDLDPIQTARLRGQISFAKKLLLLGEEPLPFDS